MSYKTKFDFQGEMIIFIYPLNRYNVFYQIIAHYEADRCRIKVINTQNCVVSISPGNTVAYQDCR